MGRDWYALRLKEALGLPYARAKRIGGAAKAARPAFQTELGAIVTSCELNRHDPEALGALTRRELSPTQTNLGRAGQRRTDLVDALLPHEVASTDWLLRIEDFIRELDHLDDLVDDAASTSGHDTPDELLRLAIRRASWLSSEQRRWLSAIRQVLIADEETEDWWWWAFDPRRDLLGPARVMGFYDLRLRPVLGERLTWT